MQQLGTLDICLSKCLKVNFFLIQKRKKAGKVKRGREKQMMKKMINETPNNLKEKNCSVLVGLLT